ncbi:MAG: DUF4157 domain-containing protein [Deltaproteobacteria bacterium]|nr:DUF4157 domain-containing protein [Deltaproteobacteria bacterium]
MPTKNRRPEAARGGGSGSSSSSQQAEQSSQNAPSQQFGQATQGGGSEIPYKAEMEAAFGEDLSGVESHVGEGDSLGAMGADAAASGNQIAFSSANPDKEQVAHELTHVFQGGEGVHADGEVSSPSDASEVEARHVGAQVAAGGQAGNIGASGAGIQLDGDAITVKRASANQKLNEFILATVELLNKQQSFQRNNWTHYLSRTGSNPALTMEEVWGIGLAGGAVGGALTAGLMTAAAGGAFGAKIGTFLGSGAPVVGNVIGAVVGFLIGAAIGWIIGKLTASPDTAAADASEKLGDTLIAQFTELDKTRDDGVAGLRKVSKTKGNAINRESDEKKLDTLVAKLTSETEEAKKGASAINPTDFKQMALPMIERWSLQHAGDEENEGYGVNEEQWERATGGKDLDGKPDLYTHQTELEFGAAGLDPTIVRNERKKIKSEGMNASQAIKLAEGWFKPKIKDKRKWEAWYLASFRKHTGQSYVSKKEKYDLRSGKMELQCDLDCTTADGTCYIHEWEWEVVFPSVEAMGSWYDGTHSFETHPDSARG